MSNYFDQVDTDQRILLTLDLGSICGNGSPDCKVVLNGEVAMQGPVHDQVRLQRWIPLLDDINLEIALRNKQYSRELETALLVNRLVVDDIDITLHLHRMRYHTDRGEKQGTYYLGFNGSLVWHTVKPFYHWLHEVEGQGWLLKPR